MGTPAVPREAAGGTVEATIGPPTELVGLTLDSFTYKGMKRVSVQISLFSKSETAHDELRYRSLKFVCDREPPEKELAAIAQELVTQNLVRQQDREHVYKLLELSVGRVLQEPLAYSRAVEAPELSKPAPAGGKA